jgi:hypothetical protein
LRRRAAHAGAVGALAATALLAGAAVARAARRGELGAARAAMHASWKTALAFAAFVAAGGAFLASRFESGTGAPFVAMGAALVPMVLVARAWGATGAAGPAARAVRASVSAVAVVAAGFLVLEWIDVRYLASFGL